MVPAAIIARKRDGHELSAEEIVAMIRGFLQGEVADYQMAAFAMAIVCRGMTSQETAELTSAMLNSGQRLERVTERQRVDKHSTGGLGDSTSLILAPLLACLDFDVPMLSGRGLGITGGTLDKLESITGYRCDLTTAEIASQLRRIGCVITGTTPDITPADRRLYALRDVTATVESIALITASIMSKKLAETLDALVLDVKFGSGAFMPEYTQAASLARSLIAIGHASQLPTRVLLTSMEQPLGRMVGNACEVNEALEVLEGATDAPLARVTLELCNELLVACGKARDAASAKELLQNELTSGRPLRRFQQMVEAQHGRWRERYPTAPAMPVLAEQAGYVIAINGRQLGNAIIELGGGRKALGHPIDHSVGLEMLVRLGDTVIPGQPLVNIMAQRGPAREMAQSLVQQAIAIGPHWVSSPPLIRSL